MAYEHGRRPRNHVYTAFVEYEPSDERRLERWRDHHAWADTQGGMGQLEEETHKSGEIMGGAVKTA